MSTLKKLPCGHGYKLRPGKFVFDSPSNRHKDQKNELRRPCRYREMATLGSITYTTTWIYR